MKETKSDSPPLTSHQWKSDGVSPHNGEYWYKCTRCGSSDWIASYGSLSQLQPKECVAKG